MSAPSKSRLALSDEAYEWAKITTRRKADFATKLTLKRRQREVIASLASKFDMPPEELPNGQLLVNTTRVEVRYLQEIAEAELRALRDSVLPNYEARGKEAEPYVVKTKERIKTITEIMTAVGKVVSV